MSAPPRTLVVGGGIFGVTAAVRLARTGRRVELFERSTDILSAASGINQYRLHRGYHYPRSDETALSSLRAEPGFRAEYGEALVDDDRHYYCIAKRGSFVDAGSYLDFCRRIGLEFKVERPDCVSADAVELCVRVKESLIDPVKLRSLCWERLRAAGVDVRLGRTAVPADMRNYDLTVICAYASINPLLADHPAVQRDYQFEVCEKPVARLPARFAGNSLVVMDGPFMCADPFGRTGLFVLGNVVHAIHKTSVGRSAEVPPSLSGLLDRGVLPPPPETRFPRFIESAEPFLPGISGAEHVGSMFTVRTVLPGMDDTDARPTLVESFSGRAVVVFSGKIGTCVQAADRLVEMLEDR